MEENELKDKKTFKDKFKNINKTKLVSIIMGIVIALIILIVFIANFQSFQTRYLNTFKSWKQYSAILKGLGNTMLITILAFIIGVVLGIITCLVQNIKSDNVFVIILKNIFKIYVAIFRGTPMLVQLLIFYYVILSTSSIEPLYVAVISFGLNSGAYVSEIIRGGINAVPQGQVEAGRSLGLSYTQVMFKVVFPQALRNCLPSLGNELITLVKETSIVSFISAVDLTKAFTNVAQISYDYMLVYILMGIVYFVIVFIITKILKVVERMMMKHVRS